MRGEWTALSGEMTAYAEALGVGGELTLFDYPGFSSSFHLLRKTKRFSL